MFNIINNLSDFKKFISCIQNDFECIEDLESLFGFELSYDEDTGLLLESVEDYDGDIENKPESFPAIVYYVNKNSDYRSGNMNILIMDYITMDEVEKIQKHKGDKDTNE